MQGRRIDRIEEQFRIELSGIIDREIHDPRIGLATVTQADLASIPSQLITKGAQLEVGDSGGGVFFVSAGGSERFLVAIGREIAVLR